MRAFFDRHESNKDTPPEEGNGKIAWLLWGGDAGRRWAEARLRQLDDSADKAILSDTLDEGGRLNPAGPKTPSLRELLDELEEEDQMSKRAQKMWTVARELALGFDEVRKMTNAELDEAVMFLALQKGEKPYCDGPEEEAQKTIREQEGKFCVFSEDGDTNFGCFDTREAAEARLRQIETFADKEARYTHDITIEFPITKSDEDQRLVYGIVLEPEVVDAQKDVIGEEGIETTAHRFLARYNRGSETGLMHKMFGDIGIDVVESYIAPMTFVMGGEVVRKGSWVLVAKVWDDQVWRDIKEGRLTGFSVAGMARIAEDA